MFPQGFAGALRMALSACGVVLWLLTIPAQAAQVTLAWDDLQNPPSAVGGYNLYYWQGSATTPVRVNAGKQLTYTLTNLTGGQTYSFAVTAYDVNGGGETALSNTKGQVSTTLPVGNVAPVATNGVLTTTEDTPKSGTLSATDADGNALTYRVVTPASKGTVTVTNASTGAYTYTPLSNATGTDTFTFRANDGQADSNTATVTVTITAVNDAPVANAQSVTTAMNTPVTITLAGSDGDGNPLTFTIATGPVNGTLSGTPPAVTYTPKANFSGTDSFTFRVSDGTAISAPATVALSITMTNVAPVATNGTLSTTEDTPRSGTLRATDANGNALTYSVVTQGSKGTAVLTNASTGAYTYTPKSNANGTDTFTFRASDGLAQSNLATVTVTITPVNDAP
jgi:VCBS repeat-containing protein